MDIAQALRERRTVDIYKQDSKPADELIHEAIELACLAPNHKLTEPWRYYLLGQETAAAVVNLNAEIVTENKGSVAGDAKRQRWQQIPGWLVVTQRIDGSELQQQEDYAACACAIQNLQLFLWGQGIGCKWTTGPVTRDSRFYDLLWIDPSAEKVVGLVWYGYSALLKSPPAAPRQKSINDVLIQLP